MPTKLSAHLYELSLPFKFTFKHAVRSRSESDSLILEVSDGSSNGYGEIVVREYVTGLPADIRVQLSPIDWVADILRLHLARLNGLSWDEEKRYLAETQWARSELPILCGLETALMDLECTKRGCDIYELLETEVQRSKVTYGAVLPLLPDTVYRRLLEVVARAKMRFIKIKLLEDPKVNARRLEMARAFLESFCMPPLRRKDSRRSGSVRDYVLFREPSGMQGFCLYGGRPLRHGGRYGKNRQSGVL
jgi:L-alanine-DL-glutamate epimerase-like enolase superfamily enzyme